MLPHSPEHTHLIPDASFMWTMDTFVQAIKSSDQVLFSNRVFGYSLAKKKETNREAEKNACRVLQAPARPMFAQHLHIHTRGKYRTRRECRRSSRGYRDVV